jgi:hypothetical protein
MYTKLLYICFKNIVFYVILAYIPHSERKKNKKEAYEITLLPVCI